MSNLFRACSLILLVPLSFSQPLYGLGIANIYTAQKNAKRKSITTDKKEPKKVKKVPKKAALTPYQVINTADSGGGSLRDAINQVNAGSFDAIYFNIPAGGPGYDPVAKTWTITPATDLPTIVKTVVINGYTQFGSVPNADNNASNAILKIIINGSNYTVGVGAFASTGYGLHLAGNAASSAITGLVLNEWIGAGIYLDASEPGSDVDDCSIIGNFIGTNAAGTIQQANQAGILINNVDGTLIGNATVAGRNVIAGSFNPNISGACVSIYSGNNTVIQGNLIGLDATGTQALGFSSVGIFISSGVLLFSYPGADGTIIGGTSPLQRNVISGHSISAVIVGSSTMNTVVQGNYIGTDVFGKTVITNANQGITMWGPLFAVIGTPSTNNIIGGTTQQAANLVAGSGLKGIGLGDTNFIGATQNTVEGNRIGTTIEGSSALGNNGWGIVSVDSDNTIGGLESNQGNIVSANAFGGILVYGQYASGTLIQGNLIGTGISGTNPIPNGGPGIQIGRDGGFGGSSNIVVGS